MSVGISLVLAQKFWLTLSLTEKGHIPKSVNVQSVQYEFFVCAKLLIHDYLCLAVIAECVATGWTGVGLVGCVTGVIGAASDCFNCVCWVIEYLGFSCS